MIANVRLRDVSRRSLCSSIAQGPPGIAHDGEGAMPGVGGFGVEGFQRLLLPLFTEMGFHPERSERGSGTVDLFANDPTPIRGGRLYVHGLFGEPGVATDADEVRNMIDTARAEFVGKGVLVTLGTFTSDARDAARGNPIDLVDGDELGRLVRKHMPQAFAQRKI